MSILRRYQYVYAVIDPSLGDMCVGVYDTTNDYSNNPNYILLDTYNEEYICKYYNRSNGKWYLDSSFITEWSPN